MTVAGKSTGSDPSVSTGRSAAGRSVLPVSAVVLCAAIGVLVSASAYTAGRLGQAGTSWADRLYWFGQLLILAPIAARLLSRRVLTAGETLTLVVVLTVAEYLVKVCYSPAAFTYVDELMHWRTAANIMQTGKLFTPNNLLPISPYYPGLEEVTSALATVTGLSIFSSGLIVAGTAHLLFVAILFVLFRHVSGSHRVAGVAMLLYASESLFQSFDSMFVYQTLALPFLGLTLLAVYRLAQPQAAGSRAGWFTVAALAALATVVTHHVTSYLLVATLEVITLGALLTRDRALAALGPGNRFATDEGDFPVLGSYGDQNPILGDAFLYTSPMFTQSAAQQVQALDIQYALVDQRLSEQLPVSGSYFPIDPNSGEYTRPLPSADLAKFNSVPGVARIYDSGNIVIYDLTGLAYYGS